VNRKKESESHAPNRDGTVRGAREAQGKSYLGSARKPGGKTGRFMGNETSPKPGPGIVEGGGGGGAKWGKKKSGGKSFGKNSNQKNGEGVLSGDGVDQNQSPGEGIGSKEIDRTC